MMVKVTTFQCSTPSARSLVLIPGGPGLSSKTLHSLRLLNRSFNLHFMDMPGTNGVPYDGDHSFNELSKALADEISKLDDQVVMLGHSFGGFFAADVALRLKNVIGLVSISTPFTSKCMQAAVQNYELGKTPALVRATETWNKSPSDSSFADWLSEYDSLYFAKATRSEGKKLLKSDPSSYRLFLSLQKDKGYMDVLLARLKNWKGKKIFIAGELDALLPPDVLKTAIHGHGFEFNAVLDGSHFVTLDKPDTVAGLIEKTFATEGRNNP